MFYNNNNNNQPNHQFRPNLFPLVQLHYQPSTQYQIIPPYNPQIPLYIPPQMHQQIPHKKSCCRYSECAILRSSNVTGVAVAGLNKYYGVTPCILLGKEKGGNYKGQYNLCAGGIEKKDKGCPFRALAREMYEEFKLPVMKNSNNKLKIDWGSFEKFLKWNNGNFVYVIHNGTPVFIANFTGVSTTKLNKIVKSHNGDIDFVTQKHKYPFCYREMAKLAWFKIADDQSQDGTQNRTISTFAKAILKKIRNMSISFLK